jgi:rhodanese-related sulfurtransferase
VVTAARPAETGTADRPAEAGTADRSAEAGTADRPTEAQISDRPAEAGTTDRPTETRTADRPAEARTADRSAEARAADRSAEIRVAGRPAGARTIDEILAEKRRLLRRLTPAEAYERFRDHGALIVDIRPAAQRAAEGEVPGALIVERNVLEWRFDPASDARLPQAAGYDVEVIVICSEGYTSSLAAAALHELGLTRSTDVVGGFQAWRAAGLPATGPDAPASGA